MSFSPRRGKGEDEAEAAVFKAQAFLDATSLLAHSGTEPFPFPFPPLSAASWTREEEINLEEIKKKEVHHHATPRDEFGVAIDSDSLSFVVGSGGGGGGWLEQRDSSLPTSQWHPPGYQAQHEVIARSVSVPEPGQPTTAAQDVLLALGAKKLPTIVDGSLSVKRPKAPSSSPPSMDEETLRTLLSGLERGAERGEEPLSLLDLSDQVIGNQGVFMIQQRLGNNKFNLFLTTLILDGCAITPSSGVLNLASIVAQHPSLTHLSVARNPIGLEHGCPTEEWHALRDAIGGSGTLKTLNLRECALESRSVASLASTLATHTCLTSVDLRDNKPGLRGGWALADAAGRCKTLLNCLLVDDRHAKHRYWPVLQAALSRNRLEGGGGGGGDGEGGGGFTSCFAS